MDVEEAEKAAAQGGRLLASRREVAAQLVTQRAVELQGRVEELRGRVLRLDEKYRSRHSQPLAEENLFIAQV